MTLESILYGLLAVSACFCVGALAGAAASVAYQAISSRGERSRFSAELEPLREEIDSLADSMTRFRRKTHKRDRDDVAGGSRNDDPEQLDLTLPPRSPEERAARIARLKGLM